MKRLKVEVKEVEKVNRDVYRLSLHSPYLAQQSYPGQFIHLRIPPLRKKEEEVELFRNSYPLLRRPFSIHRVSQDEIYILFKIRGRGTKILAQCEEGEYLDVLGPLGRGFNYTLDVNCYQRYILLGGGIGVAPLLFLGEKLGEKKGFPSVFVLLGAKQKEEVLCEENFLSLGFKVMVATDDGSKGFKGTVVNLLSAQIASWGDRVRSKVYACGPREMIYEFAHMVKKFPWVDGEVLVEEVMGCGIGACCSCVVRTKEGYKKVCKEGPVFKVHEILF